MKERIFEKNGLPNPLGMTMIILIIGLVCLIQCILTQPVHAQRLTNDVNYIRAEMDPEIRIEEWMVDPNLWHSDGTTNYLVEEPDPEIAIEYWMTDFSIPALVSTRHDPGYEIEAWMFDETFWISSEGRYFIATEVQNGCFENSETEPEGY